MKQQTDNRRRDFFKRSALTLGGGFALSSFNFYVPKQSREKGDIVGHGDFKYRVNKEWGQQDPAKVPVRDCHEMVQDRQGRLILLTNEVKNNIIIYDRSGKVLKTWTLDLPGAHGLTITEEGGEERLFITDSELHVVYKTTLDGKVLMKLEYPKESYVYADHTKFKPTEVAMAPNGDFYVADGYGEYWVIQYNSKGEYIRHFGGKGDGESQLNCAHGVVVDQRDPSNPVLLVTSRSANELKTFTLDGKYIKTIKFPGSSICRPVIKGDYLYFAVIVTESWWAYDGAIIVLDKQNQVVSAPGAATPEYKDGVLKKLVYDQKTFLNPHDVCVDQDENLYIPQWYSGKTYPVMLERV
ncbi:MAG: 6-bladed beta-propeller [Cyclobacteriaceae bacterium]|nr:6-bladed beta-propeller [Cyclobacteriaceae bacterium HetDA_MAG_MS6]